VVLHVQDALEINYEMTLGATSEIVTVEAGASLLNTESATVSTVIDRTFVENLPLNGRSFQTLIMLAPGAVVTAATFDDQGQFSVNGQRADANYFTVDGVSANFGVTGYIALVQAASGALPALSSSGGTNSLVSVDALQEFPDADHARAGLGCDRRHFRRPGTIQRERTARGCQLFHRGRG